MFKAIVSSKRYWMSVCYLGLGLILISVIYSIVKHISQHHGFAIQAFVDDLIENQKWVRYIFSRVTAGLLYGMIMGYYFELRKRKSNR